MRYFSVTEALVYLNQLLPGAAPKNEETLRRAIRTGDLKAERRIGREGNKINEPDLIEYSKKYLKKAINLNHKMNFANVIPQPPNLLYDSDANISQILKKHITMEEPNNKLLKIELIEAKRKWESQRNILSGKILSLENELTQCNNEIKLIDDELEKLDN